MKLLALITDTFREIYARKVVFGIIAIELLVLLITGLVLFSEGQQEDYRKAAQGTLPHGDTIAVDSARIQPQFTIPDDTSLLGSDDPPLDTAPPATSSRTFDVAPGDTAAHAEIGGERSLVEMVSGELSAFAGIIAAAVVFLGIFATAGIIPSMMEKGTIDLLLSKPIPRWTILFGRALGGLTALAINLGAFLLAIWALYGIATGVWLFSFVTATFLISLFTFVVIYSAVILLNVTTEGWILPMSLVYIHMVILANFLRGREETLFTFISSEPLRWLIDGLYYALPQTNDLIVSAVPTAIFTGGIDNIVPFAQGTIFMVVMLGLAAWRFERRDF